jgi:hypothetical protein
MKVLRENEVNDKADGTYYCDWTTISYFNLINLLGLPTYGKSDDNKVLCEWVLESNNGAIATIYDYKSDTNDPEFVTRWHLGGNENSYNFIQKIKEKIRKSVDAHNLVC